MQNEKVVETKICRHCLASFPITDKDLEFYEKVSPVFSGKRYSIPVPTLCPDCMEQRRFSFRNERNLYKRKCDKCSKDVVSLYSPDKPYTVYCQDCWWSDDYSPSDYGMDFDFSKSFFEQFNQLFLRVPKVAIQNAKSENCAYTNYSAENKNSYLVVGAGQCEDCYFWYRIFNSKSLVDCYDTVDSEFCYECMESVKLFDSKYCRGCQNSSHLILCENCVNCSNCFWCTNLENKQYCIFNEKFSKEDYDKKVALLLLDLDNQKRTFSVFKLGFPRKNLIFNGCENSSWNQLNNCQDVSNCFTFRNSSGCKFSSFWENNKDCVGLVFWDNCELQYDASSLEQNNKVAFGSLVWYVNNGYYLISSFNWGNMFWCTGIKNGSYLILNKQYTREEYEALVPRIIEHMQKTREWGEFFPSSLSPFGYNETVAMEYYPMVREEVLKSPLEKGGTEVRGGGLDQINPLTSQYFTSTTNPPSPLSQGGTGGTFQHWPVFNWSDYEAPFPRVEKIIPADKLPDDISKIPDDILNWAIECEVTKKPFRIIKQELEFYRKHHLPIPRRHPDQRHLDRMALRNPRKLFERKCDKCGVEMVTTYSPERKEMVYCESCYEKEVIR